MEIFVAEDDTFVSLEEALAFIDGCDINDQSLTDTLVQCSPVDLFSQITPLELIAPRAPVNTRKRAKPQRKLSASSSSQDDKPTKKRRARSAGSSSTRLQQRKRAEIQALREQAQELETQVELLKQNKFLSGDVVLELDDASMSDGALRKTNRRLKSILANQEKVNGALQGLLQKRSVLSGMDYVFAAQLEMETAFLSPTDATPSQVNKKVQAQMEDVVRRMHKAAKAHFKEHTVAPAISCDMRIKQDPRRGKMIEFVTSTPMSCSLEDDSEIVWKELSTYREYPDKLYRCFVMSLKSPSGMLELDGVQYLEKFEEMDRTIVAVAERMVLPSKSLQYWNESWLTITPAASDAGVAVVEIFLQLYLERDDGLVACPEDLAYAQDVVMGCLGNTLRKFFQTQQNSLMEKAGRVIVASTLSDSVARYTT
ncbi:hypothetical protein GN958_ATG16069 [Phytophthora infestans]|uniref:Uncharacterized protein n=1 Tax=Phytophthora infestans TaxID=4787 RepID=A0A8S9U3I7_PHYIN|nr:hypothetical protein GN958_ATG16069 [Phytophthora infestans]